MPCAEGGVYAAVGGGDAGALGRDQRSVGSVGSGCARWWLGGGFGGGVDPRSPNARDRGHQGFFVGYCLGWGGVVGWGGVAGADGAGVVGAAEVGWGWGGGGFGCHGAGGGGALGIRAGLGLAIGEVLDGDELDVEDEVGLGGSDGGAAVFAIGELPGDEEATLATDLHALEAEVPSLDDAVGTDDELGGCAVDHDGLVVGAHDGLAVGIALGGVVIVGGVKLGAVGGEVAGVLDGVELEGSGVSAGADEGVLEAECESGLDDAADVGDDGGNAEVGDDGVGQGLGCGCGCRGAGLGRGCRLGRGGGLGSGGRGSRVGGGSRFGCGGGFGSGLGNGSLRGCGGGQGEDEEGDANWGHGNDCSSGLDARVYAGVYQAGRRGWERVAGVGGAERKIFLRNFFGSLCGGF